jgi:cell wall-associated NlpC family hydrolase
MRASFFKILRPFLWALIGCLALTMACSSGLAPARSSIRNRESHNLLFTRAESYLGTPYRYGGADRSGMDCSGLVVRLFREVYRTRLPHRTTALFRIGVTIPFRSLEPGDLVFFRDAPGLQPSHVGIFLGDGRFIHASSSRGVIISRLRESYYRKRYAGARRM